MYVPYIYIERNHAKMGMSASQARLLSITSRLTNNEFRSQTITNSKLRLAEKSEEASAEYMDALNSQQLMYGVYDSTGEKIYTALTANTLLSYGDLKNQYSLVDATGKILLNGSDIKKYKEATSMKDFMSKYGIASVTVENDDFTDILQTILGPDYQSVFQRANVNYTDGDKAKVLLNSYLNQLNSSAGQINSAFGSVPSNQAGYDALVNKLPDLLKGCSDCTLLSGAIGRYYNTMANPPAWIGDAPVKPTVPDFASLVNAYNGSRCYDSVINATAENDMAWHIEHNLSALIFGQNGMGRNSDGTYSLTNTDGSISITATSVTDTNVSLTNTSVDSTNASKNLAGAINQFASYECIGKLREKLINLYCDTVNTLNNASYQMDSSKYTITSSSASKSGTDLRNEWKDFYTQLSNAQGQLNNEVLADYNNQKAEWDSKYAQFKKDIESWLKSFDKMKQALIDEINKLGEPTKEIPDEKDAKYQWYKNLWYRMGSTDEINNNGTNFKEIDENLINNSEWLEFAFEHGVLTMEQAQFVENGSVTYPQMGQYDWVPIIYTNASDIISQEDEVAIALAEVKYKNAIREIENKDKKFDQDLKKLDTEHTALQTEYDSIKEVISKNVDRSFKAFS